MGEPLIGNAFSIFIIAIIFYFVKHLIQIG
nr:MAG TPA: hypothetical protein [Caudoviricetes sp.]